MSKTKSFETSVQELDSIVEKMEPEFNTKPTIPKASSKTVVSLLILA